jgi:DNA polymerase/3'-5' exonuclease PolX
MPNPPLTDQEPLRQTVEGAEKPRWPFHVAGPVAVVIADALRPLCVPGFCEVAGSLRRLKHTVGDIEIVYVPRLEPRAVPSQAPEQGELMPPTARTVRREINLVDELLESRLAAGTIAKRQNIKGSEMWGDKNKLAVHVATGIPVDFFATTPESFFNYLVCRTGPAASNIRIAAAAKAKGWKWNPYGPGFSRERVTAPAEIHAVKSEREVFEFVGLPPRPPWDRE